MARIYTAGIIRRGERFLCIFHRKMQCWLFAGGKLEDGEKASDCMVRELREELGIEVFGLEFFRGYLSEKNGTEWVGLFYTIYGFDGEPTILEAQRVQRSSVVDGCGDEAAFRSTSRDGLG